MSSVTQDVLQNAIDTLQRTILEDNQKIRHQVGELSGRIEALETEHLGKKHLDKASVLADQNDILRSRGTYSEPTQSKDLADPKTAFLAVKDSVSRTLLDPELKLTYSPHGIKAEQKPTYEVVTRAAQYPETTLKLLSNVTVGDTITEDLLSSLFIVQEAQLRWLQEEVGNLVVASDFGPQSRTTRWFRLFSRNTSALSDTQINALGNAAQIAAIEPEPSRNRRRDRRDQQRQFSNHRGRGSYPPRGRGRGRPDYYTAQLDQEIGGRE